MYHSMLQTSTLITIKQFITLQQKMETHVTNKNTISLVAIYRKQITRMRAPESAASRWS